MSSLSLMFSFNEKFLEIRLRNEQKQILLKNFLNFMWVCFFHQLEIFQEIVECHSKLLP